MKHPTINGDLNSRAGEVIKMNIVKCLLVSSCLFGNAVASANFWPEGAIVIPMMAGGSSSAIERAYLDDIRLNEGKNLLRETVEKQHASGKDVVLVGETKNFDLAIFTILPRLKDSHYLVSYRFYIKKRDSFEVSSACLKSNETAKGRFECYDKYFQHWYMNTDLESIQSLSWAIYARFSDFLVRVAHSHMTTYQEQAVASFNLDRSPLNHLLDMGGDYMLLKAERIALDLNTPLFYSQILSGSDPEVITAKKSIAATKALKNNKLFFASYNMQCSNNGRFPGPGVSTYIDENMFAGPILLNEIEKEKFVEKGECRHYLVGVPIESLYEQMKDNGFTYEDGQWNRSALNAQ